MLGIEKEIKTASTHTPCANSTESAKSVAQWTSSSVMPQQFSKTATSQPKKGYQIKRTQSQHMAEKTQMNQQASQSNFATFLLIMTL